MPFRALSQKRFRAWEITQQQQQQRLQEEDQDEENDHGHHHHAQQQQQQGTVDDINLLMRMQQIGAMSLFIPAIFSYGGISSNGSGSSGLVVDVLTASSSAQVHYLMYALINTVAYVTYNLASTYVLSSLSVLQHSSLNCLRRMFCTVATSIFFGVIGPSRKPGVSFLCFCGFLSFTHFRGQRSTHNTTATTTTTTVSSLSPSAASAAPHVLMQSLKSSTTDNNIQIIDETTTATSSAATTTTVKHAQAWI
jgi:hypothetical protein